MSAGDENPSTEGAQLWPSCPVGENFLALHQVVGIAVLKFPPQILCFGDRTSIKIWNVKILEFFVVDSASKWIVLL